MPFIYLLLLLAMLIKWLLPCIVISIVIVSLLRFYNRLKSQNTNTSEERSKNEIPKINITNDTFNNSDEINSEKQDEMNQDSFLETIDSSDSEDICRKTNVDENKSKEQLHVNSYALAQIIQNVLNHAMQREQTNLYKTRLKLQILYREQAKLLHNIGQLDKEIDFIKKEMESCDLDSNFYRYWSVLLKKRMIEYEEKQKSNVHSLLVSQIIFGLLNHATQQERDKEAFSIEYLYSSNIKTIEDKNNQMDSADNNMHEYPTKNSYDSDAGNNNHQIIKVPYWEHAYVYSADYLQTANRQQRQFYNYFKEEFIKGHYLNIEQNLNYAFVLMFDLAQDYKKHKNYDLFKSQLSVLAENYPRTAAYTSKTLLDAIIALNKENSEYALKSYDKSHGQLCRWVTPEDSVEVQGFKLIRGNFYIGECFLLPDNIIKINRDYWSGYKNSYIYGPVLIPKLLIDNKEKQNCVFCSYQNMTPSIRYEYLMWLSGKKEPKDVSNEVLLFYLYGCEIRMFIDPETNSTERKIMVDNILQIYKTMLENQNNFEQFLLDKFGDFIAYSVIKFFRTEIGSFSVKSILNRNYTYRDCFISQVIANKESLSPEDIFDITYKVCDIEKFVPLPYVLAAKKLYVNKISKHDNILIDKSVECITRSIDYNDLNNFNCNFYSEEIELPYTIKSIPSGFYNVNSAVNDCYWNIDSTFLLYNKEREYSEGKETVMAILLLPQEVELKNISAIQMVMASIQREMRSNQYLIKPIDWILELFEFKRQNVKNICQSYIDSIINGLRRMGYGIVPNYEVDIKRFNFGEQCVIYKNEEAYLVKRTPKYEFIELFIKLASYIVLMDKVLDEDLDFLERQVLFYNDTVGNVRHLMATIRWRFSQKKRPIDKHIRSAIVDLTDEQRTLMGNVLIRLACIDGDVHPKRVNGLKKILPLLGIEVNNIHSQIHRILTDREGFVTIEKESDAVEFEIGTEIEKKNNQINTNIILNSEKLHIFEQQTKNAQELLSEIFSDEDIPISQNTMDNTMTDKWKGVLTLLLSKEKWERGEIENKCQEMGLMLGAVLEQINEFAYDKVDDVVVEDDGEYLYVALNYKENLI